MKTEEVIEEVLLVIVTETKSALIFQNNSQQRMEK